MLYNAKISKSLEIKGDYGYLSLKTPLVENTVFYTVKDGATYKIIDHLKVNGDASHDYKIKRCDTQISEYDTTILTKGTFVQSLNRPTGFMTAGYDVF